MSIPWRRCISN